MIMRKRALEQSRYFVDQQLGDPHLTVADLQERLARSDSSFINKLLYFGANLRGTAQYWHQRQRELRALVEFMVNETKGLPSFFMTGSCAEFYFPPLRRPQGKKLTLLKIAMPASRLCKRIPMLW